MNDMLKECIKRDVREALQTPNISFEDCHKIIRLNLEKLWMYDEKARKIIKKYFNAEKELTDRIAELTNQLTDLNNSLVANDKKILEAIDKL